MILLWLFDGVPRAVSQAMAHLVSSFPPATPSDFSISVDLRGFAKFWDAARYLSGELVRNRSDERHTECSVHSVFSYPLFYTRVIYNHDFVVVAMIHLGLKWLELKGNRRPMGPRISGQSFPNAGSSQRPTTELNVWGSLWVPLIPRGN